MGFVGGVAFGIEDGGEIEAAGGADGALERAGQRRVLAAGADGDVFAFLEMEAGNVDGIATGMIKSLNIAVWWWVR